MGSLGADGGSTPGDLGSVEGLVTRGVTIRGNVGSLPVLDSVAAEPTILGGPKIRTRSDVRVDRSDRCLRMNNQDIQVGVGERKVQVDSSTLLEYSAHRCGTGITDGGWRSTTRYAGLERHVSRDMGLEHVAIGRGIQPSPARVGNGITHTHTQRRYERCLTPI